MVNEIVVDLPELQILDKHEQGFENVLLVRRHDAFDREVFAQLQHCGKIIRVLDRNGAELFTVQIDSNPLEVCGVVGLHQIRPYRSGNLRFSVEPVTENQVY